MIDVDVYGELAKHTQYSSHKTYTYISLVCHPICRQINGLRRTNGRKKYIYNICQNHWGANWVEIPKIWQNLQQQQQPAAAWWIMRMEIYCQGDPLFECARPKLF